ncbi:hypothetical protein ZWY2020_006891 [Hordeum vulgare]|nr:hypothetical protein ZWY2020_006891 [Hordeum vulgare]
MQIDLETSGASVRRTSWKPQSKLATVRLFKDNIRSVVYITNLVVHMADCLSWKLVQEGHHVTLFTRGKAPITQQLPGESDAEYAEFSSKVLHLKGDRKDFDFVKTSLSAKGFNVVYDINAFLRRWRRPRTSGYAEYDLLDGLTDSYNLDFDRGTFRKEADFTTDDMILGKKLEAETVFERRRRSWHDGVVAAGEEVLPEMGGEVSRWREGDGGLGFGAGREPRTMGVGGVHERARRAAPVTPRP